LQVGEQYEIVDEELDPESAMLVNLARKKYEVRKMLDGSVSYAHTMILFRPQKW
jgi:hypothetical protein